MKRFFPLSIMIFVMQLADGQVSYEKSIELQGGPGIDNNTRFSVGVTTTHGARLDNFFIGAGTGFRYTDALYYTSYTSRGSKTNNSHDGKYLVPIYAHASYRFGTSTIKPIISFEIGSTFDIGTNQNKNTEGLFYEPAVGASVTIDETSQLLITMGLNFQKCHHTFYYYGSHGASVEKINGMAGTLNFKIGLTF